jgi:hypothetical protein
MNGRLLRRLAAGLTVGAIGVALAWSSSTTPSAASPRTTTTMQH